MKHKLTHTLTRTNALTRTDYTNNNCFLTKLVISSFIITVLVIWGGSLVNLAIGFSSLDIRLSQMKLGTIYYIALSFFSEVKVKDIFIFISFRFHDKGK
jgi:hypothetical protein